MWALNFFLLKLSIECWLCESITLTDVHKNFSTSRSTRTQQAFNFPKRHDLHDLLALMNADKVSKLLHQVFEENVDWTHIQSMLEEAHFRNQDFDHSAQLHKIALGVTKKLDHIRNALENNAKQILESHKVSPYDVQVFKRYRECCAFDKRFLKFDSMFGTKINQSETCEIVPRGLSPFAFHPRNELLKVYENNAHRQMHAIFKWQYFISSDGLHIEYPAHKLNEKNFTQCTKLGYERHRDIFMKVALPFRKRVIILVDRGNVMSQNQIDTAKCVAKALIRSLDDQDEVTALLVGTEVTYPTRLNCKEEKFFKATPEIKEHLSQFVDSARKSAGHTNHSLGFVEAFQFLQYADSSENVKPLILYLSRGMFAQLTDGTSVMTAIAQWNLKSANKVQINTFAILDAAKAVMWETSFLRDVAAQNFHPYAQSFPTGLLKQVKSRLKPPEGKMILVNSSNDYCVGLKEIYEALKPADHRLIELDVKGGTESLVYSFHRPHGECATISFGKPIVVDENFLGVVGLDVCLSHLISPLLYYGSSDSTAYGFIVDGNGRTCLHPKSSNLAKENWLPLDVNLLEENFPAQKVIGSHEDEGLEIFVTSRLNDTQNFNESWDWESNIQFQWRKLKNTDLILVLKFIGRNDGGSPFQKMNRKAILTSSLTYHRIDLSINKDLRVCVQGRVLFNTERCGLYLSPKCFEKPYERVLIEEDLRTAQGYWAYITDNTKLITNPGLKSEKIRHDIAEWARIVGHWSRTDRSASNRVHAGASSNRPIIRKFLATPDGILLTYPAFQLRQNYEPSNEEWFQRALRHPGNVVLTSPYMDASGYVVQLSRTLNSSSSRGYPLVVASVHVPLAFLYARIKEAACQQPLSDGGTTTDENLPKTYDDDCFLMDAVGYVVAHRNGFGADGQSGDVLASPTFEQMHVTHKEAAIATELLHNKHFMQKFLCRDFSSKSVQRFYLINSSFTGVLRSNDQCLRYQIVAVPGTNVFLALVNRSCSRPAFCPCSVLDRKCLNCHRSEPMECECPCQCPFKGAYCGDDSEMDISRHPLCDKVGFAPLTPVMFEPMPKVHFSMLPACFVANCGAHRSESPCLKTIGCEWCTHYDDFKTPLKTPHCSPVSQCYGGILGLSAYGFGSIDKNLGPYADISSGVQSTPVGPVAGGIMAAFVFLTMGVLWYRRKVSLLVEASRRRRRRFDANGSESRLNADQEEDDEFEFDGSASAKTAAPGDSRNPQTACLLLASFERENIASAVPVARPRLPWRRGPGTESSDPGYSTMTGGNCDESEQATTVVGQSTGRCRPMEGQLNKPSISTKASSFDDLSTTLTNVENEATQITKTSELGSQISQCFAKADETSNPRVKANLDENAEPNFLTHSEDGAAEGQTVLSNKRCHTLTTTAIIHAVEP